MSIKGYIVNLSSASYETPSCCASCMGPRQTEVQTRASEKGGNLRMTLTMAFPYCDPCAKRARREKVRQVIVLGLAGVLGAGLALAAWGVDVGIGASIRFAIALPLAAVLAALFALITRQSVPAPPATARGEAVILRDTSGSVLCTNPQFAQLLAQANGGSPTPGVKRMTVELTGPILALLMGVVALISWLKVGAPEGTASAAVATAPPASASGPKAPARIAPAPGAPARRPPSTQPKKAAPPKRH